MNENTFAYKKLKLLVYNIWSNLLYSYSVESRDTSNNFSASNFKGILYHMGRSSDHNYVKSGSDKYGSKHINITYNNHIQKQYRATIIIKWTLLVKWL